MTNNIFEDALSEHKVPFNRRGELSECYDGIEFFFWIYRTFKYFTNLNPFDVCMMLLRILFIGI